MTAPNVRWAKENPEMIETFKKNLSRAALIGLPQTNAPLDRTNQQR